jgi:hypothetical protein
VIPAVPVVVVADVCRRGNRLIQQISHSETRYSARPLALTNARTPLQRPCSHHALFRGLRRLWREPVDEGSFLWGELTRPCYIAQKIPKFIRKMTMLQIVLDRTLKAALCKFQQLPTCSTPNFVTPHSTHLQTDSSLYLSA